MFAKILIANRGEIACRIIKTARRHGHHHGRGLFRRRSRRAACRDGGRGGAHRPCRRGQSYLDIDKIIGPPRRPARKPSIRATAFSRRTRPSPTRSPRRGIAFIGPNVKAIEAMGDKIESKKLAAKAKVSTVPGHLGVIENAKEAVKIADEIGYPVMIKASAGGGGKGMRIAYSRKEVEEGFNSSKSRGQVELRRRPRVHREISSRSRAISKFRCSATSTATSSISASANARSSAAIRR